MSIQACQGPRGVNVPCDGPQAPSQAETNENLLPAPMQELVTSGDIGAQISGLILQIGHDQKKAAHVARAAAEVAQRAAEDKELQAMRDQADAKLAAGVAGGVIEMASGAVLASGINGSEIAAQAGSKAVDGYGKIETALINNVADDAGETAKRAGNEVSRQKTAAEDARTAERDAKDGMNKALDLYKEYLTAKADAQRAAFLKA